MHGIFSRGQSGPEDSDGDKMTPLSYRELRTGLGSLGVQLGGDDFVTLLAKADPHRSGKVSYPRFCEILGLHRMRGKHEDPSPKRTAIALSREPSHQERETRSDDRASIEFCTRRQAMMSSKPRNDLDLEGGVFHRNPSTFGCQNPNYTTTMIRPGSEGSLKYRPKRHQSPAPAPGLRHAGCRPESQGQTVLLGDNRSSLWSWTGEEAEMNFRRALGVKSRCTCKAPWAIAWLASSMLSAKLLGKFGNQADTYPAIIHGAHESHRKKNYPHRPLFLLEPPCSRALPTFDRMCVFFTTYAIATKATRLAPVRSSRSRESTRFLHCAA